MRIPLEHFALCVADIFPPVCFSLIFDLAYANYLPFTCFKFLWRQIYDIEGIEREREKDAGNIDGLPPVHTPTRNRAPNLGM